MIGLTLPSMDRTSIVNLSGIAGKPRCPRLASRDQDIAPSERFTRMRDLREIELVISSPLLSTIDVQR
jgi:hypothetical protein